MALCILDASATSPWLFQDEANARSDALLVRIEKGGAAVPALWYAEIGNGLIIAERKSRLSRDRVHDSLELLRTLPLDTDVSATLEWSATVMGLMRTYELTFYDATYLELAQRRGLPLATLDKALIAAAPSAGVPLMTAP